jgi:hypothetical protein
MVAFGVNPIGTIQVSGEPCLFPLTKAILLIVDLVDSTEISPDEIRQARALHDPIVPDDGNTWGKLGSTEEIAHLLLGARAHGE